MELELPSLTFRSVPIRQMIKKENIPPDPGQSFRFFSWKDSLKKLHLYQGEREVAVKQGMGDRWHHHPEVELTLFTEGEGIRYIGDDVKFFNAPELVLLGSGLPHHWQVGRSSGFCIQFSLDPTSPMAGLRESSELKSLLDQAMRGLLFSQRCTETIKEMMEEALAVFSLQRLAVFLKILAMLNIAGAQTISSSVPQGLSGCQSEMVRKAVLFIVENATDEHLELQSVLDHVRMSRATFSRHFQQALGQSFTHFVQSIRLEIARNLLATTDKPVTEIAYAAGFSNLSHFNALFKKRWAMTPRALRRSLLTFENKRDNAR